MKTFFIPEAPSHIKKDTPIKRLLDKPAITCLAHNLRLVDAKYPASRFIQLATEGIEPLGLMARSAHIAQALRATLPPRFSDAVNMLMASLTPPNVRTEGLGLSVFFYLPHTRFVAEYGLDAKQNAGEDPFPVAMQAQYELTRRFTAEYSIRTFLIHEFDRTLAQLKLWVNDPDPHVRRLCSEGCRPRLPWGIRIPQLIQDPTPAYSILEALKDDPSLYVRRSVANHIGDIAKDHPEQAYEICTRWLVDAGEKRHWIIRHGLRYPAKKGDPRAILIRQRAGTRSK